MTHTVVIAGVGPGLGASIARKFAAEGCAVGLFARSSEFIEDLADELNQEGEALAVETEITDPDDVAAGFEAVREAFGPVDTLINHASGGAWKRLMDLSVEEFDDAVAVGARGGFLCSSEAVSDMLEADGGTVIFTGATTSVRGNEGALGFSAGKLAVRGMAESMARDLGPQGIHVSHVVIDGGIRPPDRAVENPGEYLDPDAIAENYWHLTQQDESAWTLELDLRPHVERF